MQKLLKLIWTYIDVICYLAAVGFIVWGFFRLNITAGIFAVGVALIIVGLATEMMEIGRASCRERV